MQSKLSRREIVAGIAAAPVLPATLMQAKEDTELAALGEQFTDLVKLAWGEPACWKDKAFLARLGAIGTAIMDTQATTIEDLVVKARIAYFVQASGIWYFVDPNEHQQPGFRFAMSMAVDLVRRHDPDLGWTGDIVPSAERARRARDNRDRSRGA